MIEAIPVVVGKKTPAENKKSPTAAFTAETKATGLMSAPSSRRKKKSWSEPLLALLKYPFYPLFILDNGMDLISKSLTVLTPA